MRYLVVCLLCLSTAGAWAIDFSEERYIVHRGDTNSDGYADLLLERKPDISLLGSSPSLVMTLAVDESYLILGNSSGGFGTPVLNNSINASGMTVVSGLSFGDFNGDGVGDLVVQGLTATQNTLLVTGGTPSILSQFTQLDGVDVSEANGVLSLFDYDSDGYADLVWDPNIGAEQAFINSGTGAFSLDLGRTTRYTYTASGLVKTIDGPRTDVSDVTTFEYDSNDQLKRTINALGHVTEIVSRDARGYPTEIRNENGVSTVLVYDPRARLTSQTIKHPTTASLDATTSYEYYLNGLLEKITLPDGTFLKYEYDDAQRLTAIESSFTDGGSTGERMEFVLDDAGNREEDIYKDASGAIVQKTIRQFDELSRLHKLKDNDSPVNETEFDHDPIPHKLTTIDALNNETEEIYDPLKRVKEIKNALNDSALFEYDGRGNLTKVTDQRGIITTYEYDSADNLLKEVSPDAGTTIYAYDQASNLTQMIDARGIVTNYTYDALNRLTHVKYPSDATQDITYLYDIGAQPNDPTKGRLMAIVESNTQINYTYDHRGNVLQDSRTIDGTVYTTDYTYDLADNIETMTYPSGRLITYERDAAGRVKAIKEGGTSLISNVEYHPFGQAKKWDYTNGLTQEFVIDMDGRIEQRKILDGSTAIDTWTYNYDEVHNVDDIVKPAGTEDYEYDALYRLKEQTPIGQAKITYTYDEVGNRKTETQSGSTTTHTYPATSNRHTAAGGLALTYDAAGNRKTDLGALRTYTYDSRGRMEKIESGGSVLGEYLYNAEGQRVQSDTQTGVTDFVYDTNGTLIGSFDGGVLVNEWIYLNESPVVQLAVTDTNLHPDNLGSPRIGTDSLKDIVWRWEGEAFGSSAANEDPDGDGQGSSVQLRFPGQFFDSESGLHYNQHRTYDPNFGRYTQRDPLGLSAGFNGYAYVGANPLVSIDPDGLRSRRRPPRQGFVEPCVGCIRPISQSPGNPYEPLHWQDPNRLDEFPAFLGNDDVLRTGDQTAYSCPIGNRDACKELIEEMLRLVYAQRTTPRSGYDGIAPRYNTQRNDPGNLYQNNRESWNSHNEQIRNQQRTLRKLIERARRLGCYVPPEVITWAYIQPPSVPSYIARLPK